MGEHDLKELAKAADMQGLSQEFADLLSDLDAARSESARLAGERAVLARLLRRCGATIETIVPESDDEADLLAALERDIERALSCRWPAADDLLTAKEPRND